MRYASALLFPLAVAVAGFSAGCNAPTKGESQPVSSTVAAPAVGGGGRIAYVNLDTLEAKYELLKTRRNDFKKRQEQMEGELQRSFMQMQNDAADVQKKVQANALTQSEYATAEKRLVQMQQSLETRKQTLTEQLMKEQEDFNNDLKTRLDGFLAEYIKTHPFDYVLSYTSAGSSILYVNKQLDITNDVVAGMNASSKEAENQKK